MRPRCALCGSIETLPEGINNRLLKGGGPDVSVDIAQSVTLTFAKETYSYSYSYSYVKIRVRCIFLCSSIHVHVWFILPYTLTNIVTPSPLSVTAVVGCECADELCGCGAGDCGAAQQSG